MKQIALILLLTSCVRVEPNKEETPRFIVDVENTERNSRGVTSPIFN